MISYKTFCMLSALCDALLPKLQSVKLPVPDALTATRRPSHDA